MKENLQNQPLGAPMGATVTPAPVGVVVPQSEVRLLNVAPTLRKMKVGDVVSFPIEQRSTVLNTLSRFRSDYARIGWDAVSETDKTEFVVKVTRIG